MNDEEIAALKNAMAVGNVHWKNRDGMYQPVLSIVSGDVAAEPSDCATVPGGYIALYNADMEDFVHLKETPVSR